MEVRNTKVCPKCNRSLSVQDFYQNVTRPDGLTSSCKTCHKIGRSARRLRQRRKARIDVIIHYGGQCACCQEGDLRFLTLDHIRGGGTRHRKQLGNTGEVYAHIVRQGFPPGYQILCWNCNCGRSLNQGICPHKDVVSIVKKSA